MSYRIVIADKDAESREAVTRFLGQPDSQFIGVSTSGELKDVIKSQKPDLIILNAVLSDAPGWRIVERIKQSQQYADVPIILMTGDPETPPLAEVQKTGADDYLVKPIDGTALRSAVNSLLGVSDTAEGGKNDEDILIEFSDDGAVDAGEEMLAVSTDSLEEEPATALGDTVEIDTGTLVGDIGEDEEPYGDTVRLNFDDMGLEDQLDDSLSMEPTIELVSDVTPTLEDLTGSVEIDSEEDYQEAEVTGTEALPDFSSITMDVGPKSVSDKDSVTVDFDAEDLGLELLSDMGEAEFADRKAEAIDPDDTEIERILEVRDPSKILTSEDLMVDDDSLIQDSLAEIPTGDVEIIDLEEDNEIAEIDMEKLEGIDVSLEKSEGLDLDETTVPVESTEMEQWAKEDLAAVETEEFKDTSMPVEPPPEDTSVDESAYESIEGLSLEDAAEEEMTTEEFFGEELPTQEFPTERFPDQETGELTLEQEISLEESEFEDEISLEGEPFTEEIPQEQLTFDTTGSDEMLSDETAEEEAIIEITDDLALDEISVQDAEEALSSQDVDETEVEIPEEEIELAPEPTLELAEEPAEAVIPPETVEAAEPPEEQLPPPSPAAMLSPEMFKEAIPSQEQLGGLFSSAVGTRLKESFPEKVDFAESLEAALKDYLPAKQDFSDMLGKSLESVLPTKEETLEAVTQRITDSMPDRETILARVDGLVKDALADRDAVLSRIADLAKDGLPDREAILERMEGLMKDGLPNEEAFLSRADGLLKDRLPAEGLISQGLEQTMRALLPSSDAIMGSLEQVREAVPSKDDFLSRLDQSLERIPAGEEMLATIEQRLGEVLPASDEIRSVMKSTLESRIDAIFAESDIKGSITDSLPGHEEIVSGLQQALPEKERFQEILAQSIGRAIENSLPERVWLESVSRGLFDERTKGLLPDREEVVTMLREEIQAKLLDTVEKIVKDQIERISSELST